MISLLSFYSIFILFYFSVSFVNKQDETVLIMERKWGGKTAIAKIAKKITLAAVHPDKTMKVLIKKLFKSLCQRVAITQESTVRMEVCMNKVLHNLTQQYRYVLVSQTEVINIQSLAELTHLRTKMMHMVVSKVSLQFSAIYSFICSLSNETQHCFSASFRITFVNVSKKEEHVSPVLLMYV